jgi:hypothetical protein
LGDLLTVVWKKVCLFQTGIYANMNRPDLQNQRMAPDRLLTSMVSPPPAAVSTNR